MDNILVVSDNKPFAWTLKRILGGEHECGLETSFRIDSRIPEEVKGYSKIIVDLDGDLKSGVEWVKWLWLNRVVLPILILSFKNLGTLMKENPEIYMIVAAGGRFLRKPVRLSELCKVLSALGTPDENVTEKLLLRGKTIEELVGDEKHGVANEFGASKLLEGAYLAGEIAAEEYSRIKGEIYPEEGSDKWRKLREIELRGERIGEGGIEEGNRALAIDCKTYEVVNKRPILLIDNEYEKGWRKVLSYLLYKGEDEIKCVRSPGEAQRELKISDKSCLAIPYDLILLDVRLTDKDQNLKGRSADYTRLSSLQLLGQIQKKDRSVPVILFTASDKSYVFRRFEALEISGISGLFTKGLPGISTKENFEEFRDVVKGVFWHIAERRGIWGRIAKLNALLCALPPGMEERFVWSRVHRHLTDAFSFLSFPIRSFPIFQGNRRLFNESIIHHHMAVEYIVKSEYQGPNEDSYPRKLAQLCSAYDLDKGPAKDVYGRRTDVIHAGNFLVYNLVCECFQKALGFIEQYYRAKL